VSAEAAIELADAIFFMIDSRSGITPVDRHFASLVRRAGKPLILIANKAEGRSGEAGAYEAFDLGLGDPVPLSAEHGDGFASLYEALREALPAETALAEIESEEEAERPVFADDEDGTELDETKPLAAAIGKWKEWTSKRVLRLLATEGPLWQPEFFDHLMRSAESRDSKWSYVVENPVRAGLVKRSEDWPFAGAIRFG